MTHNTDILSSDTSDDPTPSMTADNPKPSSQITLIDPRWINLHTLLGDYLSGSVALFADRFELSLPVANILVNDARDISVLCLIANITPPTPQNAKKPSPKAHLKHQKILELSVLDTQTLDTLMPMLDSLGDKHSVATALLSKKYPHIHQRAIGDILAMVATISNYYADKLAYIGKLNHEEKATWLTLQWLFVKDLYPLAQDLNITPTLPNLAYSDYQSKLGKDAIIFDDSTYTVPSYRWLIEFAQYLQTLPPQTLLIGKTLGEIAIDDTPTTDTAETPQAQNKHGDGIFGKYLKKIGLPWLIASVLILLIIAFSLWRVFKPTQDNTPTPPPSNEPAVIQDVAIVRVDDDKTQQSPTQENPKQDNPKQDKPAQYKFTQNNTTGSSDK